MSIRTLIAFLVSSSLAVTLVAQDKVFPIKGSVAIGTLQSLQRDEVTIEVRTKNQIYKTNEIAKVVFDDEPNNLDRARDFINNRQFNQAQDELNKIDVAQVKDERVLNDIQFYKGYAAAKLSLSGIGSPADAGKLLAVALKADPQSYHFYKSQELLGDLALVLNSLEPAGRYFRELQAAPFPELKALAMYKLGEVDLNGGKFAEARKQFQTVATATASDAETTRLKNLAEVGLAVCDAREGKSKEALDKLQELVKKLDSADQVLFARIYNSQGTCYLALGQNQSALLAYLKTDLLFAGSAEAHAEALYQLSQLWPKVGQPQRATEARKRLTTLYPSSVWSSKP